MFYLAFSLTANLIAIILANYLVDGFEIKPTPLSFLEIAGLLTAVNMLIRPILKFVFSPLILLTLGLFSIVINAGLLWALDFFRASLRINGLVNLFYAAILIAVTNAMLHFVRRRLKANS